MFFTFFDLHSPPVWCIYLKKTKIKKSISKLERTMFGLILFWPTEWNLQKIVSWWCLPSFYVSVSLQRIERAFFVAFWILCKIKHRPTRLWCCTNWQTNLKKKLKLPESPLKLSIKADLVLQWLEFSMLQICK